MCAMESMAAMWLRQSIPMQTDRQVTLRKTNKLTASGSTASLTLVTSAVLSIGDGSINIQAGAGKLMGSVVAKTKFQFGGTGQEYTITANAKVGNSGVINVQFTPVSAISHAAGLSINFTFNYIDYPGIAVIEFPIDMTQKLMIEDTKQQKVIPVSTRYPAPEVNDTLGGSPVLHSVIVEVSGAGYYHCWLGN